MQSKWKEKKKVKWNSILVIKDISPRKTRDWVYVILYTDLGITVCCSETQAQRLCCEEPYEMKGYINFSKGSSYLVLEKAKIVAGNDFTPV